MSFRDATPNGVVEAAGVQGRMLDLLIARGYIEKDLLFRTPEAQGAAQAKIDACYDQLAAIPRAAWPAEYWTAQRLLHRIQTIEREFKTTVYWVTEAARQLVAETEGTAPEAPLTLDLDPDV